MNLTNVPKELSALKELAANYWWAWNRQSWPLFESADKKTWNETRNPVLTLQNTSGETFNKLVKDKNFMEELDWVKRKFDSYINRNSTWFDKGFKAEGPIVYFSAEFGIHEALPIYSGGLGVLAGDHVKSSSDLGIPMAFVGLFYRNGYFKQQIDKTGQQVDVYDEFSPESLSLEKVTRNDQSELKFQLDLPERTITVQAYVAKVGINNLYLLDTDCSENSEEDKKITAKLYGGDRTTRITQEIVLGIGGVKLLNELNINPQAWHMNEGHSGFFQLERTKNTMKELNVSFEEAKVLCSTNCIFTTHTPVPAGNEAFSLPLMHEYFHSYIKELDISWHRFVGLGLQENEQQPKDFSLTIFALNFSRFHNGVSELHGRIAAKMWKKQWPDIPEFDNPIAHITNGVHVQTWTAQEMKDIFAEFIGGEWEDQLANHSYWEKARNIPDEAIRDTKLKLKDKMISMVRTQLFAQLERNGESSDQINEAQTYLRPEVLTIGFARRFATYKRATLIFKDLKKLAEIVNNENRPVQFIFAGKAHPADALGQSFIKEIYEISRAPEFKGKVIILENYDMNISRHMVAGVDVWLNNPRRPMEASGTSGQKVPLNSGLNFSVLDGWWREGFNGKNGWTIGEEKDYPNTEIQDFEDAHDFYRTLNETIVPLYYDQSQVGNISNAWLDRCKESLISNISHFSTHRMVQDYTNQLYMPAIKYAQSFRKLEHKKLNEYINTRRFIQRNWPVVALEDVQFSGSTIKITSDYNDFKNTPSHHVEYARENSLPGQVYESVETNLSTVIYLGDIPAENVKVELIVSDGQNEISSHEFTHHNQTQNGLHHFKIGFKSEDGKTRRLRVRFYPYIDGLQSKFEFATCSWF
jgi:glycogen phosphorylase